jgi:hypothetical protein
VGEEVLALDRSGQVITKGRVVKVKETKKMNLTKVVSLAVPKELAIEVRFFRREKRHG